MNATSAAPANKQTPTEEMETLMDARRDHLCHRRFARWATWGFILCVAASVIAGCGSANNQATGVNITETSVAESQTAASGAASGGSAHITKPFDRVISGSQCYAGTGVNKGDAAFGFPTRDLTAATVAFTLGPLNDGASPGQEHNPPYTGAGSYDNIGILVRPLTVLDAGEFGGDNQACPPVDQPLLLAVLHHPPRSRRLRWAR